MDYSKYYEARNNIVKIIEKDLLGPISEEEIICDERPLEYYILGKLYPMNDKIDEVQQSSSEDCGEIDDEIGISLSNSNNPSSFGLSFAVNAKTSSFIIQVSAAKYNLITYEEAKEILKFDEGRYNEKSNFWQRRQLKIEPISLDVSDLEVGKSVSIKLEDNLFLSVLLHKVYEDGTKTLTVTMINKNSSSKDYKEECLLSFFQPKIVIRAISPETFVDVRRNAKISNNPEVQELNLLYSRIHEYASGHGCAVTWDEENGEVNAIRTQFLPVFELNQMKPASCFSGKILEMKYLATATNSDVIDGLKELVREYSDWIDRIENDAKALPICHLKSAEINIKKCRDTLDTLIRSIDALKDPIVFKAFSLANEAMYMQRKKSLLINGKFTKDEDIKWYPFQLAFFLQEVISFACPDSDERSKVDLLWFPTGGGKTEAYLGIAAFVIFLRRLRCKESGEGVTILMRYTLRLLSFQQFERASAMICACELIRQRENIPGGEIGIGLWAGKALTPNKIAMADNILHGGTDEESESSNPVQIKRCPWCGNPIDSQNYFCDIPKRRMLIKCANAHCEFSSGLPVYLIDEEIYVHTPAFVIATVDKFAQIALNQDTSSLFGVRSNHIPPELIIQDELHLISGPLGTLTGLYEAAIKKLCVNDGVYPKIVASTATIRNAKEQIKALYVSDYTQFPPQGIDINDSFFAELSTKKDKPSRLYVGCMAIGTSPTTMMIRVMSSLLFASRYLVELGYDEKVIDSFWTLTGYFNALRELGGAIIRVVDDIQDRFNYLKASKFAVIFPLNTAKKRYDNYKELTSREKSENIGNVIQNELKIPYKTDGSTDPFDFLLSSNMISVGVDVGRLGTMVVVGQPKTTSEYIQATSRVGRETPGLVITTYNQAKSRDRSHYEDFTQYHESFYKFVEATSVTPFSDRARDRALQALYVALCRNLIPELAGENDAINFKRVLPGLEKIRKYILDYVDSVDPAEHNNVLLDIEDIEKEWEYKCDRRRKLKYRKTKYVSQEDCLFEPDYIEDSRFRVLNTMRSVETMIAATTYEGKEK